MSKALPHNQKKVPKSIALKLPTWDALEARAKRQGITRNLYIERVLENHLINTK